MKAGEPDPEAGLGASLVGKQKGQASDKLSSSLLGLGPQLL